MTTFSIFGGVDWASYIPALASALLRTIEFTLAGLVGSVVVGGILAVMRVSRSRLARGLARAYTELFMNLPLVTEIFIVYFGLASVGIVLTSFVAGSLSLVLLYGAYMSEVFRGGLEGVPKYQRESAHALGMTGAQTLRDVILPQAIRLALPGTGTLTVDLLKGTSLLVTIGAGELMTEGGIITSATFRALQVYIVIGAIYFACCFPLSRLVTAMGGRLSAGKPISPMRAQRLRQLRHRYPLRVDES